MNVLSVNIATPKEITLNGKKRLTGMYKNPVKSIFISKNGVKNDLVADKVHHGGWEKAVYLYGKNNYDFFKKDFPKVSFKNGLFGENITVSNLDESTIHIGDEYSIGSAIIKITEPRLPCNTLGYRFGSQKIVKHFMNSDFCGAYCSVVQEGEITKNDSLTLIKRFENSLSLVDVYSIYSSNKENKSLINKVIELNYLPKSFKERVKKRLL